MKQKICTSIEQSKKLIELGIDRKTSDMYYWCGEDIRIGSTKAQDDEYDISAWSLTALLGVLPLHIIVGDEKYSFSMRKGLGKNGETYAIKYAIFNTTFYLHLTDFYNSPIDAAFEMICWLKENKKI